MVAGPHGQGARGRPRPGSDQGLCQRLGRGALDRGRRHRSRGADAGHDVRVVRRLLLASGWLPTDEGRGRAALPVWRARGHQGRRDRCADRALTDSDAIVHLRHLSVVDFRSYAEAELPLTPGVTTMIGLNGQGKTNLVEAVAYLAPLGSHRVASDAPLVRFGAHQAIVRGAVIRDGRETLVEIEINVGRASNSRNRARLNRSPVPQPREVLGTLRTVMFAPEDLALVKGDPAERRSFLDELLVARQPRWAGVRSDYDKVLKQRNALLKSAAPVLRRGARRTRGLSTTSSTTMSTGDVDKAVDEVDETDGALHTLDVWNTHLARVGAQLLYARLRLMRDLAPYLAAAYDEVSDVTSDARIAYRSSLREEVSQ